ncbi:MAG: hypothetical protein R3Y63_11680 [Eubacteriales bacterium]
MSVKRKDEQNRWRNKVVAFRMSPEEADMLDKLALMSGLSKQDYIIAKLLNQDVIVQGNPRVFKQLRNHMFEILEELKQNGETSPTKDQLDTINYIGTIMEGFQKEGDAD